MGDQPRRFHVSRVIPTVHIRPAQSSKQVPHGSANNGKLVAEFSPLRPDESTAQAKNPQIPPINPKFSAHYPTAPSRSDKSLLGSPSWQKVKCAVTAK